MHQPVDARSARRKRGISPLAERAALRALNEGARAPGGRVLHISKRLLTSGFLGFYTCQHAYILGAQYHVV